MSMCGTASSTRTAASPSRAPISKARRDACAPATVSTSPRPERASLPISSNARSIAGSARVRLRRRCRSKNRRLPRCRRSARRAPGKAGGKGSAAQRPSIPLTSEVSGESDELLGGNARPAVTDAVATKVLVNGEAMPAPAGRADDFAWPRRDVAPVGKDPVVATTDLPMTPMVADRGSARRPGHRRSGCSGAHYCRRGRPAQPTRRVRAADYAQYRPDYRRQQQFNFFPFLFGGGR